MGLLNKIDNMKDVLKDCLNSVSDLSLEIYILMNSVFKDLEFFWARIPFPKCTLTFFLMTGNNLYWH